MSTIKNLLENKRAQYSLVSVLLVGSVIVVSYFGGSKTERLPNLNSYKKSSANSLPSASGFSPITDTVDQSTGTGRLLYIKDGDVWVGAAAGSFSIKLIDGDTISQAEYSDDLKKIAYTKEIETQTISNELGSTQEYEVVRQELYVASSLGDRSLRVAESVADWGWVPNTELLWFESAELQQLYSWQYASTGNVFIVDSIGGEPKVIIDEKSFWSVLGLQWDPMGRRVGYVRVRDDEPYTLVTTDRVTGKTLVIFQLPYLGGDRGGPAPIPSFFWNMDGSKLYTGFTTLGYFQESSSAKLHQDFKLGKLTIFEIDTNTGKSKLLLSADSCSANEEVYPPIIFSQDFSQIVYSRIPETVEKSKFLNSNYWSCGEKTEHELIFHDLKTNNIKTLFKDPIVLHANRLYGAPSFLHRGAPLYIMNQDKSDLEVLVFNLENTVPKRIKIGKFLDEANSYIYDYFNDFEGKSLFILVGSKSESYLLRVTNKVTETSSYFFTEKILEGVSFVKYYPYDL